MIHDISLTIANGMVVWPGGPQVELRHTSHIAQGDMATVTHMSLSAHTGTHVDAPRHFLLEGGTVEGLALDVLIGPALVVDASGKGPISAEVLDGLAIPPGTQRLLIRTTNSDLWVRGETAFVEGFVAVTASGARWLVERGVRLIGVDYLSVAPFDDAVVPHEVLLGAAVVIVEGLNLSAITPGTYQLVCLPLKIADGDGAPARAVLIDAEA